MTLALTPLDEASLVLVVGAIGGLVAAALFALTRRGATTGIAPRTVLARGASYAGLALVLLVASRAGVVGIAILVGVLGFVGVLEWTRLFDLPLHHRVAMLIADVAIVAAVAMAGTASAAWLVGGLVLAGAVWPVLRADPGRAIRDLGFAAVGVAFIPVLLAHGVALAFDRGEVGIVLFVALAIACAFSDVGAFLVGRRIGGAKLSERLSPNKTRAGVIGNVLGAAIGLAPFAPVLVLAFGPWLALAFVPIVAGGAVWGDLLESASKREAHVKDAGAWLPGFGGILDRIDSLLITVALAYWVVRVAGPVS